MIAELMSDFITQFISAIGYGGVFILMTLESAALPIPSEVVMPFAGYLVYLKNQGISDLLLVSIVGTVGCTAGSVISYYVGAKGGRPFIEKYGKYVLIESNKMELAEKWFIKYGDRAVFFSRLLPVVRTFISLPAGIGKYNKKKLITFSFMGSFPWCFALAYVGYSLGPFWKVIIDFFNKLDIIVILAIILMLLYYWKIKKMKLKRKF